METKTQTKIDSYLAFRLSEEHFALNVDCVINILEIVSITEVPKAPPFMKGVINLRGEALPVIDLRVKLGIKASEFTKDTCVIVLDIVINNDKIRLGAIVDSVQDVLVIKEDEIKPPPTIGGKFNTDFILGISKANDKFLMILDLERIFEEDEVEFLLKNTAKAK